MKMLAALDAIIARYEAEIAAQDEIITRAIAAKEIRDGTGYWRSRHLLKERLRAARGLREGMLEAAE